MVRDQHRIDAARLDGQVRSQKQTSGLTARVSAPLNRSSHSLVGSRRTRCGRNQPSKSRLRGSLSNLLRHGSAVSTHNGPDSAQPATSVAENKTALLRDSARIGLVADFADLLLLSQLHCRLRRNQTSGLV